MMDSIEVHGHRGSRGTHVENTFSGFFEAARAGAQFIELDLQLSADSVPIVYHDPLISGRLCYRRHGGLVKHPIPIRALRAAEIKQFFCGTYVDPRFPDQKLARGNTIPLLEEVFAWKKEKSPKIRLNLEIKMRPNQDASSQPELFAKTVVGLVRKYDLYQEVLVQSFQASVLEEIKRLDAGVRVGRLFRRDPAFVKKILEGGLSTVTIHHRLVTRELVGLFQQNGIKVLSYTINKESNWKKLLEYGLDGIITDYPAKLVKYLNDPEKLAKHPTEAL